jgi:hypothetical protein
MTMERSSLPHLREGLVDSDRVIGILKRAQRELSLVIDYDEGVRANPLRAAQLHSITLRLNSERSKRARIAKRIDKSALRPGA